MGDVLRHAEPPRHLVPARAIAEAALAGDADRGGELMNGHANRAAQLLASNMPQGPGPAMTVTEPLNIGQVLAAQARLQPDRTGARDLTAA